MPERKSHEIEIGWTVATLFTFLFFFWWAASDQLTALAPPKDALEIHVVAKQWMWRFQHPSGAREIDELHVPAHTNVRLAMTSQDVIHDLYLPALRLKQDILPDRYTYEWFNATKTGIFHFTCAEFCGTDHSIMAGTPGDHDAARTMRAGPRRSRRATISPTRARRCFIRSAARAAIRRARPCTRPTCTAFTATSCSSPTAARVTADEAYLRDCILLPDTTRVAGFPPIMPNFTGSVSEGQIVELVAYIKSLTHGSGRGGAGCNRGGSQ